MREELSMKVLVIGSGGREHALAWKLAESKKVSHVFVAPGNGGTAKEAKCSNVPFIDNQDAWKELADFAKKEMIDFTVVGPEAPLAAGIVNHFRGAGLNIIGADKCQLLNYLWSFATNSAKIRSPDCRKRKFF